MTSPPEPWFPIRTERLLLRDFRETDFDDVHAYARDPEVARYMPWGPNTPGETRKFLARSAVAQAAWPRLDFGFALEHAAVGRVIGSIALHLRDAQSLSVEIGYCLHRGFWRQGLISEAARALIDAGFRKLGLHRIAATCDVRNAASFGVMEKLGMRREACFRQDRQIKGEWRDTYLYAVLAEEWL
ncbi:MAG TPA: GNAT family protein [Caulobacteraceae bacterium]|nr:GNAT family protein [Caulobacteraceae bacterium]